MTRFTRLHTLDATTTRLCGRNEVNATLSFAAGADAARFAALLRKRFGDPDAGADVEIECSYAIGDRETGAVFEAYVGPSGPSYGAAPDKCYENPAAGDYRLRTDFLRTLMEFERWLESTPIHSECA